MEKVPELDHFEPWIGAGKHGDMDYLAARNESGALKRGSLEAAAPWARSVIVCALNYNSEPPYSTASRDPARGWISRYAWFGEKQFGERQTSRPTDYHDAILARLRELEAVLKAEWPQPIRTWCYVDTGPVVERVWAKYAGIGWIGKNTCLLNQDIGSWLFLGVLLTSIEVPTASLPIATDRCGSCTRCIDACPTQAITEPYQLDARRCISYLTIEKRGSVPQEFRAAIGQNVFGCDICQDVCPWNGSESLGRRPPVSRLPEFTPRPELVNPDLESLASMSREEFNQMFRGTPIKRAKYQGMLRNAAIAMGNSGERRFVPILERLASGNDPVVAEHADWALQRLRVVA